MPSDIPPHKTTYCEVGYAECLLRTAFRRGVLLGLLAGLLVGGVVGALVT
jgi:thiamine transporter ThiT